MSHIKDINNTLNERATSYGAFRDVARVSQGLKAAFRQTENWPELPYDAQEALDLIAVKVARILVGNPEVHDSWHDIAGYATLVADRINGLVR